MRLHFFGVVRLSAFRRAAAPSTAIAPTAVSATRPPSRMKPTPIPRSIRRSASRWPLLLATVAIACTLTACGGDHDDDDTPQNPEPPTQPAPPQAPTPVLHCAP